MTVDRRTLDSIIEAACGLLLEARLADFLAFLSPRRIAAASAAKDFKPRSVSESSVRHHFSKGGNARAFDLDALLTLLLGAVRPVFDVSPFDEEAQAITAIGNLIEYQLSQPLSNARDPGALSLLFVCVAAVAGGREEQIAAVAAINSLIADVEQYLRAAQTTEPLDIERVTMTYVYAGVGNALLGRRLVDDPAGLELQRLITCCITNALMPSDVASQIATKPSYGRTQQQLGPHRQDAGSLFGAIFTASLSVIEDATIEDYLGFLTSTSIANRAGVDRKTVVACVAHPDRPTRFDLPRLLALMERAGMLVEEAGHEAGTEILWRLDSIGAASRAEHWRNDTQLFHDAAIYEENLASIGRRADAILIKAMQQAEAMLIGGYRAVQRVTGHRPEKQAQHELIRLVLTLFSQQISETKFE